MRAGGVTDRIPHADNVEDSRALAKVAETGSLLGRPCPAIQPEPQFVHRRIKGRAEVQQMDVQTYFFRHPT